MTPDYKTDFWDIGRTKLHTLVYPDNGPATLFLHANGMSAGTYLPFYDHLANRLHLMACDLPGHGLSGPPEASPIRSWHSFVPDLQQLLDRHFDTPVNVVGHSLGAMVAYLTAARYPRLFRSLVMIDPVIFPRPKLMMFALLRRLGLMGQVPIVKAARRRKYLFDSREKATRRFMAGKGMFKTWRKPFIQAYLNSALDFSQTPGRLRCMPETEAQIFSSLPRDVWRYASKINCPVLLLRGQHSDAFVAKAARQLCNEIPNCRLETIADTTHFLPMEKPERVATAVVKHLTAESPTQ